MIDFTADDTAQPVSIASEHGPLHGELALRPAARGIVVLAHAAPALDGRDQLLAAFFRQAGLSTLSVDLLSRQEEHFSDVHNNVPLLAKRLLDFLGLLKTRMLMGELPPQAFGLCAANDTSPAVVRVAALRDHDIAAIVCRGGLIDLAGMLYLRSLESPLLMLVEEHDAQHIASNRRALQEIPGPTKLRLIPEIGLDFASSIGFESAARASTDWFLKHFQGASDSFC